MSFFTNWSANHLTVPSTSCFLVFTSFLAVSISIHSKVLFEFIFSFLHFLFTFYLTCFMTILVLLIWATFQFESIDLLAPPVVTYLTFLISLFYLLFLCRVLLFSFSLVLYCLLEFLLQYHWTVSRLLKGIWIVFLYMYDQFPYFYVALLFAVE